MWKILATCVTSRIGRLVSIAAWIILPITLFVISPSLTDVSSSSQEDFLPVGVESTKAIQIRQEHFPTRGTPGLVVYHQPQGLTEQDMEVISSDFKWLESRQNDGKIVGLNSIFNNPEARNLFLSNDETSLMVSFAVPMGEELSTDLVQEEVRVIRSELMDSKINGLDVFLTGPAGILEDAISVFQSIDGRITTFAVIFVLVILLAIYRAPLMAIFPLLSAGLAYMAASGIVAICADKFGLTVNAQATSIMVVLIFGAGTDYMLFISSRFKAHLRAGAGRVEGISETMKKIGPAIFASAATTILAMLVLGLATLRSFQVLGPVLALGMALAILSGLTFVPAVLSLLGKAAYWPSKILVAQVVDKEEFPTGFWGKVGQWVSRKPLFTAVVCTGVLLSMSFGTLSLRPSYDLLNSLPTETESVQGYEVLGESFTAGRVSPTDVFMVLEGHFTDHFDAIESLSRAMAGVEGVAKVISPTRPFGVQFDYVQTELLKQRFAEIGASGELPGAGNNMVSRNGDVVKVEVIFGEEPGALETLDKIKDLRDAAAPLIGLGVNDILVGGSTAIQYDTKVANDHDVKVIGPIVLAVIFVVLVILLRAIVAPIYLLGSVLLSFFGSLGLSVVFFQNVLGHDGIGSGVPIYMFLFLVALGVDYNIYIITNVKEQSQVKGLVRGTVVALSNTGGVITSAGIILASTFLALTTLPLRDLFQLGFVVSLGVLIDTFFVRGFMVPSFVILFKKWNWWPSKSEESLTA